MTLAPLDYGVVATNGLPAKVIRAFERHNVNPDDREGAWANHAFLFLGGDQIAQAQPGGFSIGRLSDYDGMRVAFSSRPLTDAQRERGRNAVDDLLYLRLPYGWPDIAALGLSTVGVMAEPVWHRLEDNGTLICSQAVARVYQLMGDPLTTGPTCRVTPAHLARHDILTGGAA